MTVAAIILAASPESALADADGMPAVRRIADSAWSGGATPIIVVSFDPAGAVATALAGAPVTLAEPVPAERGPAAQMARGVDVAMAEVVETDAFLVWPARMAWVGPETVTSLIEAHGPAADAILRPAWDGEAGWPALVPTTSLEVLRGIEPDRLPDAVVAELVAAGTREDRLDLGDPGVALDARTPRSDLPAYVGPVDPPAGHVHEWGAQAADATDEGPLEGPALAPYSPAGAVED
jgi:CTP:molybdopterin cytidylyltransferase MocA